MAIDTERQKRTMSLLSHSGYDALICSSATEVLLLTGYWPVMAQTVVVFSADGAVTAIVPEDEVGLAKKTSATEIIPYQPATLDTLDSPLSRLREPLRRALKSFSASKASVGIQMEQGLQPASYAVSAVFRPSFAALLSELLPEAKLSGCDELVETMKAVKTTRELEILHTASIVAAAGFQVAEKCIKTGRRENEIAAEIQTAFDTAHAAECLQRSYGYFFCMSGPNSATAAAAYARTRHRVIQEGDLVMIHANTCADGYWTDITRTYCAGTPSRRQEEMRSAIDEARAEALRSVRPGATGSEIDSAARSVMEAAGFGKEFKHATGHGVGFAAANPNARPRIHPLSNDALEEGMTFNLEPAAYFEGYGGMRHCDVIAVTARGAKVITDF
ncbi:M24 family metallopeptidase [Acidicapsa dinghuensis]|uniref:M24 family metallopeptidase n=1 Tax=Acidicapsa dinghuensis TaxID=2218256 RepID=A0ABW1EE57_9BACT|nr:Xaa-Pro peptidase family protein [Acidicapsa dinghuensis]